MSTPTKWTPSDLSYPPSCRISVAVAHSLRKEEGRGLRILLEPQGGSRRGRQSYLATLVVSYIDKFSLNLLHILLCGHSYRKGSITH